MNCRDSEPLLSAELDGALATDQRAALAQHVAECPACRQLQARLREATAAFRTDAFQVAVPDADEEWRTLRAQLSGTKSRPEKKRPLAPVIWFSTSLAAAAAVAVMFFGLPPKPAVLSTAPSVAQSNAVEANSADTSTISYVDQESGWLVVLAADSTAKTSG